MQNICTLPLALILAANLSFAPASADFTGTVVGVSDGDTITVLKDGRPQRVRLNGIDCPEKAQDYGQSAKRFTAEMSFQKQVTVIETGVDRYGRTLGEVYLADGRNLNNMILENGYAWWYRQYSRDQQRQELERHARELRTGLWTAPDPEPPWQFRHHRR